MSLSLQIGKRLHIAATNYGLKLAVDRTILLVTPAKKVPHGLAAQFRSYQIELLAYLVREFQPAEFLARQVLVGEFDGADLDTIAAVQHALKPFDYDLDCLRALVELGERKVDLLRGLQGKPPMPRKMKADKSCGCDICCAQRGATDSARHFPSVMKAGGNQKEDTK